jgi:heme-degrading monooxygenase HmoA
MAKALESLGAPHYACNSRRPYLLRPDYTQIEEPDMHLIFWQFQVKKEKKREFVRAYGPEGDWAQLFRQAEGFEGTQLLQSVTEPSRFMTVDQWADANSFANFKKRFADTYAALDERCSDLTVTEQKLGSIAS